MERNKSTTAWNYNLNLIGNKLKENKSKQPWIGLLAYRRKSTFYQQSQMVQLLIMSIVSQSTQYMLTIEINKDSVCLIVLLRKVSRNGICRKHAMVMYFTILLSKKQRFMMRITWSTWESRIEDLQNLNLWVQLKSLRNWDKEQIERRWKMLEVM